jgi:hypothetical protein
MIARKTSFDGGVIFFDPSPRGPITFTPFTLT